MIESGRQPGNPAVHLQSRLECGCPRGSRDTRKKAHMARWQDYQRDCVGLDADYLLSDWRWLVPNDRRPILLTAFGDWFFERPDGKVEFLDTVGGVLSVVARTTREFSELKARPENQDDWFMHELAALAWDRGLCPDFTQCLGWKVPPVIGGPLEFENLEVTDLVVHQSILGQIHRQAKDLPEGTPIKKFVVRDSNEQPDPE